MATSAFKSTTKRAPIGGSSSRSLRRSRSLSRFSRSIAPEAEPDYIKNAQRGKFVKIERGSSSAAFPEISLDDLALEFFSSSSLNENESDGGKERVGRSVSRRARDIGRWASDTASSRRRGRSVSRSRGDTVSSTEVKKVFASSAASSRRRRSLSTAPYHQTSDSESELDHSWSSSNRADAKMPISRTRQMSMLPTAKTSSNLQLGRSRSNKNLSVFHDGYSSQSSALTDEESKDTRITKNGFEKIIRTVYARNKADHPTEDAAGGGMYEAMKKELRYAVQEIRTELNQTMGGNHTASHSGQCLQSDSSNALQDFSGIRDNYVTKDKSKDDLLAAMLVEEQQGLDFSTMAKELPNSRTSSAAERPSKSRKRSTDRSRMSKNLIEEADKIIEDFVSSFEDTDISSFDGERSDCSSSFGGMKSRNAVIREEAENYKSAVGSDSLPAEMDGVILPWLQWETNGDGSLLSKNSVTPKALKWDSEKETVALHDPSSYSVSSHGSWSPGLFSSPTGKRMATGKSTQASNNSSSFHMEEYVRLENKENILFEMYRERNRISSGGLLLCSSSGAL